jgi:hypothetical protein
MDYQQLPTQLVQFLAPYLPYLVKGVKLAGQEAAKKLGEKAGEQGFEQAKALWDKLRHKKNVEQVARTVAALPDNQALREALREEIARALEEDTALAQELARLLEQSLPAGQAVVASGNRSVAIGSSVSGSVIVTGDENTVHTGKYNISTGQVSGVTIGDRSAPPQKSKGITMIPVESSMVDSVGYDEERRLLQVMFTSGQVYCYEDVPPEVFQGLLEAESKGQYMRAHIIDVYPYRRGPCRKK